VVLSPKIQHQTSSALASGLESRNTLISFA
jgi:hypothetical protein